MGSDLQSTRSIGETRETQVQGALLWSAALALDIQKLDCSKRFAPCTYPQATYPQVRSCRHFQYGGGGGRLARTHQDGAPKMPAACVALAEAAETAKDPR